MSASLLKLALSKVVALKGTFKRYKRLAEKIAALAARIDVRGLRASGRCDACRRM